MALVLTVISSERSQLGPNATKSFDSCGGIVGRAQNCDWMLPDPSRVVSQRHFKIDYRAGNVTTEPDNGTYAVTDLSSNGTVVNDHDSPLGRNVTVELSDGDVLQIGNYRIVARINAKLVEVPLSSSDPFFSAEPSDSSDVIADKLDPLAILGGISASPKPSLPGAASDHTPITEDAVSLPSPGGSAIPDDWNPLDTDLPPEAQDREPPMPSLARQSDQGQELLAAFLRGAGVDENALGRMPPEEFMELAGKLVGTVVINMRDMLMARSNVKHGLGLGVTMIQPKANNPLKFAVGDKEAIVRNLFNQRGDGYLGPEESLVEAFNDIKAHEVGILAGMRAVFEGLLGRFDPKRLERQFGSTGGVSLIKKARLWDSYCEFYRTTVREAEEDRQMLFSADFQKAYSENVGDR